MTTTKLAELIAAAAHECDDPECPCDPDTTIYTSASTGGVVTLIEGPPETIAAVVQPELDRLTERIPYREGETEEQYLERQVARWRSEAWQARGKLRVAEAERDQLTYERRLLYIARIVLDRVSVTNTFEQARDEAGDLAQRIVDEIGHSVTDEPALGPSFRAEIEQLNATIARVRTLHARCEDHTRDCDDCLGRNDICSWCGDPYPCPTIAAIDQPGKPASA